MNGLDKAERRAEIISILAARGHATTGELAQDLNVHRRTIMNDILMLYHNT